MVKKLKSLWQRTVFYRLSDRGILFFPTVGFSRFREVPVVFVAWLCWGIQVCLANEPSESPDTDEPNY